MSNELISRDQVKSVLRDEWVNNMPALFDPVLARMLSRIEQLPADDNRINSALPANPDGNNSFVRINGLNPCPFCGGEKVIIARTLLSGAQGVRAAYYVRCESCRAHSGIYDDINKAASKWNGRNNGANE